MLDFLCHDQPPSQKPVSGAKMSSGETPICGLHLIGDYRLFPSLRSMRGSDDDSNRDAESAHLNLSYRVNLAHIRQARRKNRVFNSDEASLASTG
jgi:hypothetical protein